MKSNSNIYEMYIKFLFQLEEYLEREREKDNYFYQINLVNFLSLNSLFECITVEEKEFLLIYFNNELTINEKVLKLNLDDKNKYYYQYSKIIKKIEEVLSNGVL